MLDKIRTILRDSCGLEKDKPVLVGVSGGPDSLCLLSLLHEAGCQVVAAHFNHALRLEADEEAAAVEAIAGRLGIRFVGGRGDVRQFARLDNLSIETAARELRYRFLFAQAHHFRAQAVAVGHTADDQVETVLMHFIRGAGLNGLKGMPYRTLLENYDAHIALIRPLLDIWRSQTVEFCETHQLRPHYDISNDSLDFVRNRLRHEMIPALETYNPRFREAVWRSGKTLSADYELLSNALEASWKKVVILQAHNYVALDLSFLSEQPPALQMHMMRRVVQLLLPGYDTGYAELQRAVTFIADSFRDRTDFVGGLLMLREADVLYVTSDESHLPSDQWPQMSLGKDSIIFVPPAKLILAAGWRLTSVRSLPRDSAGARSWDDTDRFQVLLDAQDLPDQLELRVRKPGDRFEPLGMEGHTQKLSDFFVNAKMPLRARARWPLLCAAGQVIWVPGYRPAHPYRLRPDSTNVLCLEVTPPD
jgi:tRNA(Ile)-lysidine synthase